MNKKRTLYLHIGMPKTGTTTIQQTLAKNSKKLRSEGYAYPSKPPFNHSYNFSPIFMNAPSRSIHFKRLELETEKEIALEIKKLKDHWASLFRKNKDVNFIISAEGLTSYNEEEAKKLHSFSSSFYEKVKVVVYVRNPISAIKSNWQQRIKSTSPKDTMEDILKGVIAGYNYKFIDAWKNVFGNENLLIRPFERSSFYKNDLVKDFLHTIGNTSSEIQSDLESNASLGKNAACLLFHYNRRFPLFIKNKINKNRGLSDNLNLFYSILREIPDEPLNLDIKLNQTEATHLNNEIRYINKLIKEGDRFKYLTPSNESTIFPSLNELTEEFITELMNTYNKKIDMLKD